MNIIFNNGKGSQTADITGITADAYFSYDGSRGYQRLETPAAIQTLTVSDYQPQHVLTLTGQHVATITHPAQLRLLSPGIYIIGHRKVVSKSCRK